MSLQLFWQEEFQKNELIPFGVNKKKQVKYYDLTNTAFWWWNPVNKNSLRLAPYAFKMLTDSKVNHWEVELEQDILPKTYLQLEKHFTAPYYIIKPTKISVFGESDLIWLSLHGNDLQLYLDNQDS